jgi:DNA invertase Pin-like site-specific DNA recombinase
MRVGRAPGHFSFARDRRLSATRDPEHGSPPRHNRRESIPIRGSSPIPPQQTDGRAALDERLRRPAATDQAHRRHDRRGRSDVTVADDDRGQAAASADGDCPACCGKLSSCAAPPDRGPYEEKKMKFAFYGRVSTEDAQDPSLSLPRQLAACERVVRTAGGELIAFYWDIESGRKQLSERGKGADGGRFGVNLQRDGGLPQLLDSAANSRAFDAVIVESIDRLSRMTVDATRIERDLEQRDIALFASDEPMTANATSILTRRVKQGVAEWYVRDLIEKSRRGMEESVREGWHTGGAAPYG